MYNSEQKLRFISEITTSHEVAKSYERLFNRISSIEETNNTDLCCMDKSHIDDVITEVLSAKSSTNRSYLRLIKTYLKWCYEHGLSKMYVDVDTIDVNTASNIRLSFVSSADDLASRLDELFYEDSKETQDIIYRCFFWLAFMGVPRQSAIAILNKDVDIYKGVIMVEGFAYGIPVQAIGTFAACKECTSFNMGRFDHIKTVERSDGDLFLRTISGDIENMWESIGSAVHKRKKKRGCNFNLSYINILLSGAFYHAYINERNGIPVDFSIVAQKLSRVDKQVQSTIYSAKARYKKIYYEWKEAFGLQ